MYLLISKTEKKVGQFPKPWFASLGIFEDECRTKWGFFCNCFRSVPRWTTYCEQIGGLVVHDGMVTNVCGGSVYGFSFVSMVWVFGDLNQPRNHGWIRADEWVQTNWSKHDVWRNDKVCFCWCCRSKAAMNPSTIYMHQKIIQSPNQVMFEMVPMLTHWNFRPRKKSKKKCADCKSQKRFGLHLAALLFGSKQRLCFSDLFGLR